MYRGEADAIGSLRLGLYTEDGSLNGVGVIGAFPLERHTDLSFTPLRPEHEPVSYDLTEVLGVGADEVGQSASGTIPRPG